MCSILPVFLPTLHNFPSLVAPSFLVPPNVANFVHITDPIQSFLRIVLSIICVSGFGRFLRPQPPSRFPTIMPISLVGRVTKAGFMNKTVTVSVDRMVQHERTHKVRCCYSSDKGNEQQFLRTFNPTVRMKTLLFIQNSIRYLVNQTDVKVAHA